MSERRMSPDTWQILERNLPKLRSRSNQLYFGLPEYVRVQEATDLLQDTLYYLMTAPSQPPAEESRVLGWALKSLRTTFLTYARNGKRHADKQQEVLLDQQQLALPESEQQLADLPTTSLSAAEHKVFTLLQETSSYAEIAQQLHVVPSTVGALRYKAVHKLRRAAAANQ